MMRKTIARAADRGEARRPALLPDRRRRHGRGDGVPRAGQAQLHGAKLSVNDLDHQGRRARAAPRARGATRRWTDEAIVRYAPRRHRRRGRDRGRPVTPVVRDADKKSIGQIAAEARDLAERARDRKLKPDEITGLDVHASRTSACSASSDFAAIINPPEGGILAVGAVRKEPVVKDGKIVVGQRMTVTLSCDHRVIDGALGASCCRRSSRILEKPDRRWRSDAHGRQVRPRRHRRRPRRLRRRDPRRAARAQDRRASSASAPGGICLNWGCIPTKALLKSAEVLRHVQHAADFGVIIEGEIALRLGKIIARSRGVADKMAKGVEFLFKKYGVTHIAGTATLTGRGKLEVRRRAKPRQADAGDAAHRSRDRRARQFLPGIELDGERIIKYREAMVLPEQPKSMVVIGAGAIGVEFATSGTRSASRSRSSSSCRAWCRTRTRRSRRR